MGQGIRRNCLRQFGFIFITSWSLLAAVYFPLPWFTHFKANVPLQITSNLLAPQAVDESCIAYSATSVVEYRPGTKNNGIPIEPPHDDPENALGYPEESGPPNYVSLGFHDPDYDTGIITLGINPLPEGYAIFQLEVVDAPYGPGDCSDQPENVMVSVAVDNGGWQLLGIGCQTHTFSFDPPIVFHSVRIQDDSDPTLFPEGEDGYDLDGIVVTLCRIQPVPTLIATPTIISVVSQTPTATTTINIPITPSPVLPTSTLTLLPSNTYTLTPTRIPPYTPASLTPTSTSPLIPTALGTATPTTSPHIISTTMTATATQEPTKLIPTNTPSPIQGFDTPVTGTITLTLTNTSTPDSSVTITPAQTNTQAITPTIGLSVSPTPEETTDDITNPSQGNTVSGFAEFIQDILAFLGIGIFIVTLLCVLIFRGNPELRKQVFDILKNETLFHVLVTIWIHILEKDLAALARKNDVAKREILMGIETNLPREELQRITDLSNSLEDKIRKKQNKINFLR